MKRDDGSRWIADHHGSSRDEEPRLELLGGEFVQVHHGHAPAKRARIRAILGGVGGGVQKVGKLRRVDPHQSVEGIDVILLGRGDGAGGHRGARDEVSAAAAREKRRRRLGCRVRLPWDETTSSFVVAAAGGSHAASCSAPFTARVARRRARVGAIDDPVRAMSTAWPPPVGARVRPVETAAETVSPDGDPVPAPGAGPMWARLRYAPPSAGDDRREGMVADVCDDDARAPTASVVWEDGAEEDGVPLARLGPVVVARPDDDPKTAATNARERGNARFRAGDHAAAAAEYVEACAWLLRAIPTGARAIPGRAEDSARARL